VLLKGWQLNTIANLSTGTPFTVYDSADVSLQGSAPEISGFYSSRPDLVANPNANQPHTVWITRAPFRQLDPTTQAGQFGNERGTRSRDRRGGPFAVQEFQSGRGAAAAVSGGMLQSAESCESAAARERSGVAAFGQILQAGSPRLLQLAIKVVF
jgi:hypothetical protein